MAQVPILQRDEQYPLLNPDGGGDTKKHAQNPTATITADWNVTCTRQSWCSRWPQFLSACWMTLVLLFISFLVFYALGMSIYRRQPVLILRCNESKPAGDVFYHYIVPKENALPFKSFSDYIIYMTTMYPSLRFQVYFLVDDNSQTSIAFPKKSIFKRFIFRDSTTSNCALSQKDMRDVLEFQSKYQNVNISVLCLSKYITKTPLKYKWKSVSPNYLQFYARVYELWRNGGIGLDLTTYSHRFNSLKRIDHKLDAILRQHNDGIKLTKYSRVLDSLDNPEDNELVTTIVDVFNNIFYQTRSMFNADSSDAKQIDNKPVIRTHRSKRSIDITINNNNFTNNGRIEDIKTNNTANISNIQRIHEMLINENDKNILNNTQSIDKNISNVNNTVMVKGNELRTTFYIPQLYHVVDIADLIDDIAVIDEMIISEPDMHLHDSMRNKDKNTNKNYLTLNSDGTFVAVSSRNHQFLTKLIFTGCIRTNPQTTIRDMFRKHCSRFIFNDAYCDSIRILYNI